MFRTRARQALRLFRVGRPGRGVCPDCNRPTPWPCPGNCGGN